MKPAVSYIWGIGRRKTAVARVRVRAGEGAIRINHREMKEYFPRQEDQLRVLAPLAAAPRTRKFDIFANVRGGGLTGQADAVKLGIARALKKFDPTNEGPLKDHGLLTRDSRKKERKKYGRRGARRGFQFSKR